MVSDAKCRFKRWWRRRGTLCAAHALRIITMANSLRERLPCPICGLPFPIGKLEEHADACAAKLEPRAPPPPPPAPMNYRTAALAKPLVKPNKKVQRTAPPKPPKRDAPYHHHHKLPKKKRTTMHPAADRTVPPTKHDDRGSPQPYFHQPIEVVAIDDVIFRCQSFAAQRSSSSSAASSSTVAAPAEEDAEVEADAGTFLSSVKSALSSDPQRHQQFLECMLSFQSGSLDTVDVMEQVSRLLDGKPKLLRAFNRFLPEGYRIDEMPKDLATDCGPQHENAKPPPPAPAFPK